MASSPLHRLRGLNSRFGGFSLSTGSDGSCTVTSRTVKTFDQQYTSFVFDTSVFSPFSLMAGNQARAALIALCAATSFGLADLCCVCAIGVVDTMTKR